MTKTLLVGSGKGGVGKSTVAVNLAVALAKQGLTVGLLDADIYGPSIPIMLGLRQLSPRVQITPQGREIILPFLKFGVKVISIGFFIEEAQSLQFRGPMLHGILQKMIQDVEWGPLDVLLVDLPPGTGDVPLSLSQLLSIDGALIVCTPQEVAVLDAIKAINALHQLHIPLWGIIENMAGFTPPETGITVPLFGQGKAAELAARFQIPLLSSIPLLPDICRGGDEGKPSALFQGEGAPFTKLSEVLLQRIGA
jgi:ATP-binding protein involved in chromosome partitioning